MFSVGLIGQISTETAREWRKRIRNDADGAGKTQKRTEMAENDVFCVKGIGNPRKVKGNTRKATECDGNVTEGVCDIRCVSRSIEECFEMWK